MADKNNQKGKDQFLRDFVLELKDLNDIQYEIKEFDAKADLKELKQHFLNEFEIAFAKHLLKFNKAFAIGEKFAREVTNESNS
tara:strand:+ start:132 stop:380 length:249 start_codon:yes stop_codon:yes gene_type:complete